MFLSVSEVNGWRCRNSSADKPWYMGTLLAFCGQARSQVVFSNLRPTYGFAAQIFALRIARSRENKALSNAQKSRSPNALMLARENIGSMKATTFVLGCLVVVFRSSSRHFLQRVRERFSTYIHYACVVYTMLESI